MSGRLNNGFSIVVKNQELPLPFSALIVLHCLANTCITGGFFHPGKKGDIWAALLRLFGGCCVIGVRS